MCISFIFINPGDSPIKYKLILINNRDEFYKRSTQKATLSVDGDVTTIYGVDLAGAVKGTWLGMSVNAVGTIRVGNLANVTGDEEIRGKRGRGPIVTDFIKNDDTIEQYNETLSELSQEIGSFNFVSVEMKSDEIKAFYITNSPKTSARIPLGFIGLGNSPMEVPFKKVEVGTEQFRKVLETHCDSSQEELIAALTGLLKCTTKHFPDAELTARRQDLALSFSSIHVHLENEAYGTRTRTIILVDKDNNVDYLEETMTTEDPNGEWEKTHLRIPHAESESTITKL